MPIMIRKPNLENLNRYRIPKDFADIMAYFNKALEKRALPWIPRTKPITMIEIEKQWIPALSTNMTFVAESGGRVIGSATVFYDPSSTAYEHALQRKPGELSKTINPFVSMKHHNLADSQLTEKIIQELKISGKTAFARIALESPSIQTMRALGYEGKLVEHVERYRVWGLSGNVLEYNLP